MIFLRRFGLDDGCSIESLLSVGYCRVTVYCRLAILPPLSAKKHSNAATMMSLLIRGDLKSRFGFLYTPEVTSFPPVVNNFCDLYSGHDDYYTNMVRLQATSLTIAIVSGNNFGIFARNRQI